MTSQWRLLLREYFAKNPEEKKVVAKKLDTSVRSLDRWMADGSTTDPERSKIPRLAKVIPGLEAQMRLSLERDYPEAFERPAGGEILSNIPAPFLLRTANTLATTAPALARPTVRQSVMKQMAGHLDPDESGLMVLFAQCVKPLEPGGRVKSLIIHSSGVGTNSDLWQYRQIERSFMAGDGSLCAMAIVRGGMALFPQDIVRINYTAPVIHGEELHSCAAFPVLREGNVAGALFVGAAQPEFFTDTRRELIIQYSEQFALGLRDNEFYSHEQIDLQPLPTAAQQSEIYLYAQRFIDDLAQRYPEDTREQLEERARKVLHEECELFRKDTVNVE